LLVLSCLFFFGGPFVFAAVAVALSTIGAALTIRERDTK